MNQKTKQQTLALLGSNLKAARLRAGFTQAALAQKGGISVAYLSLIERGGRNPPTTTVVHLAGLLKTPVGDLFARAA